jgi:hypothetical protein
MMQVRAHNDMAGKTLSSACTYSIRYSALCGVRALRSDGKNQYRFWITRTAAASFVTVVGGIVLFLLYRKKVLKQIKNWNDGSWRTKSRQDGSDGHSRILVGPQILYHDCGGGRWRTAAKACGGHGFWVLGLPELITTYLKIQPWKETTTCCPNKWSIKVLLKLVQAVENGDDISDYQGCDSVSLFRLKAMLHSNTRRLVLKRDLKQTWTWNCCRPPLSPRGGCGRGRCAPSVRHGRYECKKLGIRLWCKWPVYRAYAVSAAQNFMHGIEEEA